MPGSDEVQGLPRAQGTSLGLGERLRSARKARALSVAQVAEALRLDEASVLALEEERFELLGAPVFIRGHLKRYAQLVGLSTETVLEAYRMAAPGSDAPPNLARAREQPDAVRVAPWVYWAVAALVLAGIIVAMSGGEQDAAPLPSSLPVIPEGQPAPIPTPAPSSENPAAGPADIPQSPDSLTSRHAV